MARPVTAAGARIVALAATIVVPACRDGGAPPSPGMASGADDDAGDGGGSADDAGDDDGGDAIDALDDTAAFGPQPLRRLTVTELRDTLTEILGLTDAELAPLLAVLPPDSRSPFDNDVSTQEPSQPLIEGMFALAESVAATLAADVARRDALLGCTPSGPADEACMAAFVERLGRRLLRRPLTDGELASYVAFVDAAVAADDFNVGFSMALTGLLLEGEFLYRVEIGEPTPDDPDVVRLSDFELASRISFLLWGTAPDEALLDRAARGELGGHDEIYEAAEDLLRDERGLAQLQRVHAMWLGYDQLPLDASLAESLRNETDAVVQRAVGEGAWSSIFVTDETWLDERLAEHYDIPLPGGEPGWVRYPDARRGGILSHGAFLTIGQKFGDTSPVERGKAIWERVLCNEIPAPPPSVDSGLPPQGADPDACKAERYDMAEQADCAACHQILDPLGFGLENYGPAGEWRTTEPGRPDCPIDGRGALSGDDAFAGAPSLGELVLESGRVEGCLMRNYFQYAVARPPTPDDAATIGMMTERFEQTDDLIALLLDVVASEGFRHRVLQEGN